MAKSLRSSSKVRLRGIKRENVFKPVEDARLARLAKKQADAANGPSIGGSMDLAEEVKTAADQADMQLDTSAEKISTSGKHNNKKAKKIKKKKTKTTFNFGRK